MRPSDGSDEGSGGHEGIAGSDLGTEQGSAASAVGEETSDAPASEPVIIPDPEPVIIADDGPDAPGSAGTVMDLRTAPLEVDPAELDTAINGLLERAPHLSSSTSLTRSQRMTMFGYLAVLAVGLVLDARLVVVVHVACAIIVYLTVLVYRVVLHSRSTRSDVVTRVSDDRALSTNDEALPSVTVLVPCYREPDVVADLVDSLRAMDYPRDRLQILLLLEGDDQQTIDAVERLPLDPNMMVVLVPPAEPRTKPKALNVGLQRATGEIVTVYDAEDRPEPLQLRRAAIALAEADPRVACVQAKLGCANAFQNLLTRWFNLEYTMWFNQFLPALSQTRAPIPLGGTSNHFRSSVLREAGAWDPFNVTEDADLGVRLHRRGYRTDVLDSITWEEANSDFVNWVKQRSRWQKGYLQTWFVHLRDPRRLLRELGPRGFLEFNLFIGGTPILALINPIFWLTTLIWFLFRPEVITTLLPFPWYHLALLSWLVGNFVLTYQNLVTAEDIGEAKSYLAALLTPIYWVMLSVAAYKAALQFVLQPSQWEKTVHGLSPRTEEPA